VDCIGSASQVIARISHVSSILRLVFAMRVRLIRRARLGALVAPLAVALQVLCDTKTALNASTLNQSTLAVLQSLPAGLRCTGLRVPLLPSLAVPAQYSAAFNATLAAAHTLGLAVYASPMENSWGILGGEAAYTRWVGQYAAAFQPAYLSVFNEVGADCDPTCKKRVVAAVRAFPGVPASVKYVGPDAMHLDTSLAEVSAAGGYSGTFDVLSSHNAAADTSATLQHWRQLVAMGNSTGR
jgi:hypothetical protein